MFYMTNIPMYGVTHYPRFQLGGMSQSMLVLFNHRTSMLESSTLKGLA